jgi:hypothetical protein
MLAILPLLAFLGLFWLVRKRGHGWRYAFLVSAMLWTLYLIALTELLSLQSLISRPALALGWLLLIACLLMFRGGFVPDPRSSADLVRRSRRPQWKAVIIVQLLLPCA